MSFKENEHPRDDDGKFTDKNGVTPAEHKKLVDMGIESEQMAVEELHNRLTNKEWELSLKPKEKQSAREYSSFGQCWNRSLWRGEKTNNEFISHLDNLIASYNLKENITVYRYIPTKNSSDKDYISLGYISTSLDKNKVIQNASKSYGVVHIYEVTQGKGRGAYINNLVAPNYKDVEYEFIIKRGTKCIKVDKYEQNGITYIKWRV